ncbi:MAG: hypothetical protein ACKOES_04210 [Planctomycetaceae bacterium]
MIMSVASSFLRSRAVDTVAARSGVRAPLAGGLVASTDPVDDDDLGDEEDLAVSQPLSDEESNFDDFDDEFDDDFEEEENDPDWDHPDDVDQDEPPPGKGGGRK